MLLITVGMAVVRWGTMIRTRRPQGNIPSTRHTLLTPRSRRMNSRILTNSARTRAPPRLQPSLEGARRWGVMELVVVGCHRISSNSSRRRLGCLGWMDGSRWMIGN